MFFFKYLTHKNRRRLQQLYAYMLLFINVLYYYNIREFDISTTDIQINGRLLLTLVMYKSYYTCTRYERNINTRVGTYMYATL